MFGQDEISVKVGIRMHKELLHLNEIIFRRPEQV